MGDASNGEAGRPQRAALAQSLPEHVRAVTKQKVERRRRNGPPTVETLEMATAPYNFVPLPNPALALRVPPDQAALHDRYVRNCHTGRLHVTIEALTPLFIRG